MYQRCISDVSIQKDVSRAEALCRREGNYTSCIAMYRALIHHADPSDTLGNPIQLFRYSFYDTCVIHCDTLRYTACGSAQYTWRYTDSYCAQNSSEFMVMPLHTNYHQRPGFRRGVGGDGYDGDGQGSRFWGVRHVPQGEAPFSAPQARKILGAKGHFP